MSNQTSVVVRDPTWRGRIVWSLIGLLLLWPMLLASEFKPWTLFDEQSLNATAHFLENFLAPAHSIAFLQLVAVNTWQTVAMATAAMTLAVVGAIPLTLLVNERLSLSRIGTGRMAFIPAMVRQVVRWLLVVLRSVPELVWGLLLVRISGPGPTAGVFAIALTYCGMLGKVYAEILDSSDHFATRALIINGSGRLNAFLYGAMPEAVAELVSYTIYRWECAIRGSIVLGFVGAGGLGQRMDESLKNLVGGEVCTMLIVFVLLVAAADGVSKMLRERLA